MRLKQELGPLYRLLICPLFGLLYCYVLSLWHLHNDGIFLLQHYITN